jgi:hypothetical protein
VRSRRSSSTSTGSTSGGCTVSSVDVITVPDFAGPAASRFAFRTGLFLSAWLRHEGASRRWPLHLACIGEPPAAVRHLARQAGAAITVHAPVDPDWPRACNKIRAFEVAPAARRFLLLDTDVLVLHDLAPLASSVGDRIGVGPATFNPLPEDAWRRLFDLAGVPYPGPVGTCWAAQWDLRSATGLRGWVPGHGLRMPPYYNSGVVLGSWRHGLGVLWGEHLRRILGTAGVRLWEADVRRRRFACQYALATATAALARAGVAVEALPLAYQVRPPLLEAGLVRWGTVALFHYTGAFGALDEAGEVVAGMLYGRRLRHLRRGLAVRLGLRAVRAPILRAFPPARARALEGFSRLMPAGDGA